MNKSLWEETKLSVFAILFVVFGLWFVNSLNWDHGQEGKPINLEQQNWQCLEWKNETIKDWAIHPVEKGTLFFFTGITSDSVFSFWTQENTTHTIYHIDKTTQECIHEGLNCKEEQIFVPFQDAKSREFCAVNDKGIFVCYQETKTVCEQERNLK